ncbi:hypothetical protein GW17_00000328 [Ensete ventricosum]|nr:hypothetical protein GW17_00000328 [Ensete ventricosum]
MDGHDAQEPTSTAEVPIVRLITEPLLASHPLPTPSTVASHRSRFRVFAASRRRMALSSSSFALRRLLRVSSSSSLPQWTWSPRSVYRQNSSSSTSSPSPSIFPFDDDDAASNLPPLTTPKLFVSEPEFASGGHHQYLQQKSYPIESQEGQRGLALSAKRAQTTEASRTRVFRSWFEDKQNCWMVWVIASAVNTPILFLSE